MLMPLLQFACMVEQAVFLRVMNFFIFSSAKNIIRQDITPVVPAQALNIGENFVGTRKTQILHNEFFRSPACQLKTMLTKPSKNDIAAPHTFLHGDGQFLFFAIWRQQFHQPCPARAVRITHLAKNF